MQRFRARAVVWRTNHLVEQSIPRFYRWSADSWGSQEFVGLDAPRASLDTQHGSADSSDARGGGAIRWVV